MLRKAVRINSLTELALTKLDVLDTFDEVKVCTEYDADGSPVYAVLPRLAHRHQRASPRLRRSAGRRRKALVALVEKEVGVPVRIVGTGAERDDSYVTWS